MSAGANPAPAIRVTIWNEFRHEKSNADVAGHYPDGIHAAIASAFGESELADGVDFNVSTATLDEPEHGLSEERLSATDVLVWWGHCAHDEVDESVVDRVQRHVLEGMGLVVLHSGHYSKIFRRLMGTNCSLSWRVSKNERERIWNIMPSHPITRGVGEHFVVPHAEMYGEPFDIPEPDELVFVSWFSGGEVFRSGCLWRRGHGRVFYFRPGHELYPIYHQAEVRRIIVNAAAFLRPSIRREQTCPNVIEPPEPG